ncbi:isopeptide-forming domain-containing fimbrial protein [Pseudoscardovia suis]|uniref:isopeptide-forming domain-containing fimbrial protein n=1 Tax=Pseudoscardovia suis TaxID=987063 RepID=UPI003F9A6D8B
MKTSTHAEKATARTAAHGVSRSFVALIVAAVAAIATLLAMTCVPQASLPAAHADPTDMSSITVMNAQPGRTYEAYRFATFSDVAASKDPKEDSTVASLDVTTVQCPASHTNDKWCWNFQLKNAYDKAKLETDEKLPPEKRLPPFDPAYQYNVAAFLTKLTGDQLATVLDRLEMPTDVTPDGSKTNNSGAATDVRIDIPEEGWYVVEETIGDVRKARAAVATTITENGTTYTKFTLNKSAGQSAIDALGKFYAKDVDPQTEPTKHVYADANYTAEQPFGSNFSIGDKLYYRVDAHISAHAANYADYSFVIRDQATRGLTVDESSVVLKESDTQDGAGTKLTKDTHYKVDLKTAPAPDKTTTMDVSVISPNQHAGKFLHLEYSATINSDIVTDGTYTTTKADGTDESKGVDANCVENQARIKANKEGWTAPASVRNFTGSITFTKVGVDVGVDGQPKGLLGAAFQVFKGTQSGTNELTFKKVGDGVYNYDPSSKDTVVSGADGTVKLQGLAAGKYTLNETKVPLGYAQSILALFTVDHAISSEGELRNTVSSDYNNSLGLAYNEANANNGANAIKVKNVKNFTQLPLTGAAGVALFTLMALVLGGAAAVLTVKYRRTRQQLDESLAD